MPEFASPYRLRYRALAHRFGAGLTLDDSYRRSHLPLVNPTHPDAIDRGWFPTASHALIVPVDADQLEASPAYRQMITALRASPLAPKIAWEMTTRRRPVLHATLRSNLQAQHSDAGLRQLTARLRRTRQFRARLLGPWLGNINHGRLYLPLVPETHHGVDPCARLQREAGGKPSGLYVAGLIHLRDHLTAAEAESLRHNLRLWRDRVLLEYTVRELWLQATHDSLALDSRIVTRIPLRG